MVYANLFKAGDSTVPFTSLSTTYLTTFRRFRENLRRAHTYTEWKAAAADLDQHLSNDIWREDDDFAYYDYSLIRRVLKNLKVLRERDSPEDLRSALEACVKANFG
jgi:uncharacterized protein with ATP-grasp and redox domains